MGEAYGRSGLQTRLRGLSRPLLAGWILALLAGTAAFGLTWRATSHGNFAGTDSFTYLGVAHNISDGLGVTNAFTNEYDGLSPSDAVARVGQEPLLLWPPMYPVMLAAGSPLGQSPEQFARISHALCAFAAALLLQRLAKRLSGSEIAGLVVTMLYLSNLSTQLMLATISSEVVFAPLQIGSLLVLGSAIERPQWLRWVGFGVLAAATALSRYAGITMVGTGMIAVATWAPLGWKRRIPLSAAVGLGAALPLLLWTWWSRSGVAATNRAISFHDRSDDVREFGQLVANWLLPQSRLNGGVRDVVLVAMVAAAGFSAWGWVLNGMRLRAARRAAGDGVAGDGVAGDGAVEDGSRPSGPCIDTADGPFAAASRSAQLCARPAAVLVLLYVAFVIGSAYELDRTLPLDLRMMMPIMPVVLALVSGGLVWLGRRALSDLPRRIGAGALAMITLICAWLLFDVSYHAIVVSDAPGLLEQGITGDEPGAAFLRGLPRDTVVFTNQPTGLRAIVGEGVHPVMLPYVTFPMSGEANSNLDRDIDQLESILTGRDAVIAIYLPTLAFSDFVVSEEHLRDSIPLREVYVSPAFRVLRYAG